MKMLMIVNLNFLYIRKKYTHKKFLFSDRDFSLEKEILEYSEMQIHQLITIKNKNNLEI